VNTLDIFAAGVADFVECSEPAGDGGAGFGTDAVDAFEALAGLLGAVGEVEFDAVLELREREVTTFLLAFEDTKTTGGI
jgi:hypothetical protein